MKIKLTFYSEKNIVLPVGFSEYIQAIVYNFLDRVSSEWLHENGFKYEKRSFKLFTYSSFLEKPEYKKNPKNRKEFVFPKQVSFLLSSPIDWLIKQVVQNIVISEAVRIGTNNAIVSGVEVFPEEKIEKNRIRINALAPIEVHRTFKDENGVKKTYHYSPTEKEFKHLVNDSQKRKWTSFYNEECPYNIKIEPVRSNLCKKHVRRFKGTIIEGFTGHYYIEGAPEFLEFGISTGLGSRNSGGFGMVEVV